MKGKSAKREVIVEKVVWTWGHELPEPMRSAVLTLLSFPQRPCYVLEKLEELELEAGEYEVKRGDKSVYIVISREKISDAVLDVVRTLGEMVYPEFDDEECAVYRAKSAEGDVLMAYSERKNVAVVMVKDGSPRFYILR